MITPVASATDARQYGYYFDRRRPDFVTRRIAAKQRLHLRLIEAAMTASPRAVLEVGPGEGWFARACGARNVERYVALEQAPDGRARLIEEGFDVRDATVPPIPDSLSEFDLVYASHLIEHLAGPRDVVALLTQARAVLTGPSGRVALAFPDARKLGARFWDCDYTHQWPSTPRRVRQAAIDAGLVVVAEHHCCLHRTGTAGGALRFATGLVPWRALEQVFPRNEDFWFRGSMLFAPDVLMVLRPQ